MKKGEFDTFIMTMIAAYGTLFLLFYIGVNFGFNTTDSMEKGFYYETVEQNLELCDIISFSLPKDVAKKVHADRYVGSHQKLLKFVAGLPGDKIEIKNKQICVTPKGKKVSCYWGEIKEKDKNGNDTVSLLTDCIIPENKVLAMAVHRGSFDSRYFGLVDISTVTKMEQF